MAQAQLNKIEKMIKDSQWEPLIYQEELTKDPATIRAIIGGNRTGKTEWGAHETSLYALGTHPYREVVPPSEIWIGTPSFDLQAESVQPKLLKFITDDKIDHAEYLRGSIISRLYLKNGTPITFKSYEQGPEKWQSAAKRLIWFDEEPPHDVWTESIVRQEAGIPLDIILTMTPVNGMTWVYDEIWQQAAVKKIAIKTPSWKDNTHLTQAQIDQMKLMLSSEELEVREKGHFIRRTGLVCSWWRRDVHLVDLSTFNPQGCTIWIGIDFGFTSSALCAIFVAIKGESLYIFDGIYEFGMTTNVLAQKLKEKLANLYITGWRGDSAAAEDLAELRKYGIPIEGVKKETGTLKENWDDFRARKMAEFGNPHPVTGKSRIYVAQHLMAEVPDSTGAKKLVNWFANEVENLRWKTVRTADGLKEKAEWGDGHKDAIDAFSYVLVSLPEVMQTKIGNQAMEQLARQIPKDNLFDSDGFY